jgi:hypothetical protein
MGKISFYLFVFAIIQFAISSSFSNSIPYSSASGPKIQNHILREFEDVSGDGRYMLRWEVDFPTNQITYEVVVKTLGYVGFGISPTGGMIGADIFIGGVYPNGTTYFSDRHGIAEDVPPEDTNSDWSLEFASEDPAAGETRLKFSRKLDTCDKTGQDVSVTTDTQKIIWSYGATDDLTYHTMPNRGVYSVNFLDPPMVPVDTSKYDNWTIEMNIEMPAKKTSYWCSIHKTNYSETRHIVGFRTRLDGPASLKHTHHLGVYKCVAPPGADPHELFGKHVGGGGADCYPPPEEHVIPNQYCRGLIFGWAVAGKPMWLPEHVGLPLAENGETEYFMYEIHYDNPEGLSGVRFTTAVEMFNTPIPRANEAAILFAATQISISHLIPPKAEEYVTAAHCGAQCTSEKLDVAGIKVFNVMMHSHLLGRKMKLRHFRGTTELPWILVDDNYDFDYQQNRPLREEIKVMPGDHLTLECTTNSAKRDSTSLGGLLTTDEMCQSFLWYYPRGELRYCESSYPEWNITKRFGIDEVNWDNIIQPPIVTAPKEFENKTFIDVVDTVANWSPSVIAALQAEARFGQHYEATCGFAPIIPEERITKFGSKQQQKRSGKAQEIRYVGYPSVDKEYVPVDQCKKSTENSAQELSSLPFGLLITIFFLCKLNS